MQEKLYSQKFIIHGKLADLNEYTRANRSHHMVGATMKKHNSELAMYEAISQKVKPVKSSCFIEFYWFCENKRKDKDNVAFAKKFILDGLQEANVLAQDNWDAIDGFSDFFYIEKKNPRIEVVIRY